MTKLDDVVRKKAGCDLYGRWGEVFGGDIVAAAMIDRLDARTEISATFPRLPPQLKTDRQIN